MTASSKSIASVASVAVFCAAMGYFTAMQQIGTRVSVIETKLDILCGAVLQDCVASKQKPSTAAMQPRGQSYEYGESDHEQAVAPVANDRGRYPARHRHRREVDAVARHASDRDDRGGVRA